MATQKIGLTKLGLKKNTNLVSLEWGDQIIQIKEYLPIEEKAKLIEKIVGDSLDDNNFANPTKITLNLITEILFTYLSNINFTDKQKEDKNNIYDLFVSTGLWDNIYKNVLHNEYDFIKENVYAMINEVYKYRDSVLGILDVVNQDYSNVSFDAENIQKNLADPNNLSLLKDVVTKLG